MPKTLEDAIGCWTVNEQFNSLPYKALIIRRTTAMAAKWTKRSNVAELASELRILKMQLITMQELTDQAIKRLEQIVQTNELSKP